METRTWERVLFYDGIAFMHYCLEYPEGEGLLAKEITAGYRDYLEGAFFEGLCRQYEADTTRRKRFRHKPVSVTQRMRIYEGEDYVSFFFDVCENGARCLFGVTMEKTTGLVMTPRDFGVKNRKKRKTALFFHNGKELLLFDKHGSLTQRIRKEERLREEPKDRT